MKMRNRFILIFSISILVTSCFDPSKPNFQYFPDMYESLAYETYAESEAFSNGVEAQLPPEGSIARGWEPYDYEDSNEGYELAKSQLVSPLEVNDYNRSQGKELYEIIRYFGERKKIFNIHYRNIRGGLHKFQEVWPDEGDLDMYEIAYVLNDVQYPYMLMPDHAPGHPDDQAPERASGRVRQAWAFQFGYIIAMIQAVSKGSN